LDVNRTEEQQIEALKQWWKENGKSLIGGVIIGLGAVFGWRGWQAHLIAEAEAASNIYTDLIVEVRQGKSDKSREFANKLLSEYSSTTYATFASFILAKLDVEENQLDSAIIHLQWILDNSDQDELKHLARLRMARVLFDNNKPEQALSLLNTNDSGQFNASYEELKGDIFMQQGKIEDARAAYQHALANNSSPANDNSYLQMKLDDIGRQIPQ